MNSNFGVRYYFCPNKCGRKYQHKRSLKAHLRYECGVEPQFTCDICFRKFVHNGHLRTHRGIVHRVI